MRCVPAVAALVVAMILLSNANSTTVWRCGEGGRTYSESPCPGGRPVSVADNRTAAETHAARDEVKRSQDLATRMRNERLDDEKRNRASNALAANLGPVKAAAQPAEKLKKPAKPKSQRRPASAAAAGDGTLRATAVPSRRKKD